MTIEDLSEVLCDVISAFFTTATVTWDRKNKVMPKVPLVCLDFGIQKRSYQAIAQDMSGGVEKTYTLSNIPLTIELFTFGKTKTVTIKGTTHSYKINDALDQMNAFADYMDSDVVQDTLNSHGITAVLSGTIQDTSAVHDNDYEYRAKIEYEVRFDNVSSKSLESIGIIEHAEISEEEEEQ